MASITLRSAVGRPLTNSEVDANFSALNLELGQKLVASLNLLDLPNPAQARSNLGLGNVENKSSATIRGELTSGNVTGALGYTPLSTGGGTITGPYLDFSSAQTWLRITSGPGTFNIGDDDVVNLAGGALSAVPFSRAGVGEAIFSTYAYGANQGDNRTHFGYNNGSNYVNYIRGAATYHDSGTFNIAGYQALHAGNYSSYALPLSGGMLTGGVTLNGGRLYVSSAASSQYIGGTVLIRDAEANGANQSFAAIAFSSGSGADYAIGKYTNSNIGGYLEIRNHENTPLWRMASDGSVSQFSTSDQGFTLNKSGGSGWNYIGFSVLGTRKSYIGLDSVGNPLWGSDTGSQFQFESAGGARFSGSVVLPSNYDLSWGGSYGTGSPTISASKASAIMNFYPGGNSYGAKMSVKSGEVSVNYASLRAYNSNGGEWVYLGSVQSWGSTYIHVKTSLHRYAYKMTMFRVTGFYPYNTYAESYLGCYTYGDSPSTPYGQINANQGNINAAHSQYYAADGSLVLVIYWPTTYTGVNIEFIATGANYGNITDVTILSHTASNSASGVY